MLFFPATYHFYLQTLSKKCIFTSAYTSYLEELVLDLNKSQFRENIRIYQTLVPYIMLRMSLSAFTIFVIRSQEGDCVNTTRRTISISHLVFLSRTQPGVFNSSRIVSHRSRMSPTRFRKFIEVNIELSFLALFLDLSKTPGSIFFSA